MKHILLVEDDPEIARLVCMFLESEGFRVTHIDHGDQALPAIKRESPDLLILDIMLPGLNGIEICRQARKYYTAPILMLTASDDDITEVSALNLGADDYLGKPVSPHKLLAHINSLIRRIIEIPASSEQPLFAGGLVIDTLRREVSKNGESINLTTAEYDLLVLLSSRPGQVIGRDECYQRLRGIDYDGTDRSMDMRISSLRKKLGENTSEEPLIKTVRSKGYMLVLAE